MSNLHDEFKKQLKDGGYKITTQRKAVLAVIVEHEGKHFSAEETYDIVKEKCPEIGLATVYRTLVIFDRIGIIYKINFDDGFIRYELNRNKDDHSHHHLICMKCGDVSEVHEDLMGTLEEEILIKNNFMVKDHKVKFYGYCKNCH